MTTFEGFDGNPAVSSPSDLSRKKPFDDTGNIGLDPPIEDISGEFSISYWVKLEVSETKNPGRFSTSAVTKVTGRGHSFFKAGEMRIEWLFVWTETVPATLSPSSRFRRTIFGFCRLHFHAWWRFQGLLTYFREFILVSHTRSRHLCPS
jgi:hypothetical protein